MISSLQELIDDTNQARTDEEREERFTCSSLSWDFYEALLIKLEDNSHYRITYLDGILEIMSPSIRHESLKKNLAMLLERFFYRQRIRFFPMGSSTFKNKAKKAGAEPDECYCIGEAKNIPDLVIEVIVTSGNLSKLEIYRRLKVAEVWFWERNQLKLYCLRDDSRQEQASVYPDTYGYEQVTASEVVSQIDISLLERCVTISDPLQAIDEFEQGMTRD